MISLQEVIEGLNEEIQQALRSPTEKARDLSWHLKQVRIELAIQLHSPPTGSGSKAVQFEVLSANKQATVQSDGPLSAHSIHRLTLELSASQDRHEQPQTFSLPHPGQEATEPRSVAVSTVPRVADVQGALVELLGPPGFDSSARAGVIRDAIEGLSSNQFDEFCRVLGGNQADPKDLGVRHAWIQVRRALERGPLASVRECQQRLHLLLAGNGREDVIAVVDAVWRTPSDWTTTDSNDEPGDPGRNGTL